MKKLIFAALIGAAMLIAPPASAATVYTGTIRAGQPANVIGEAGVAGAGVAQTAAACDPASDLNGLDGVWFASSAAADTTARLESAATLDGGMLFFNADCKYLKTVDAKFLGEVEEGKIPANTAFIFVSGYAGTGSFKLTVG